MITINLTVKEARHAKDCIEQESVALEGCEGQFNFEIKRLDNIANKIDSALRKNAKRIGKMKNKTQ